MDTVRDLGAKGWHSGLSTLGDFQKFILRGNVVDLAVGIVIGAAFTGIVNSFVKDLITPLIGLVGIPHFADFTFGPASNLFHLGDFINALISFIIMAAVVYFLVVKPVNALRDRFTPHKEPEAPTTRDCPFCLSTVPLKATRCAYCTAQLPPAEDPAAVPAAQNVSRTQYRQS